MSIYESEYQKYYNDLKKKSTVKSDIKSSLPYDYIGSYNNSYYRTGKSNKNKKGNTMVNIFIMQLFGILILFSFVVIGENSTSGDIRSYYDKFQESIKKEVSSDELTNYLNNVIDKIKDEL